MNGSCAGCSLSCTEIDMNCSIACLLKIDSNLGTHISIYTSRQSIWSTRSDRIFPCFLHCVCVCIRVYKEMEIVGGKDDLFALKVHSLRCLLWRLSCIYSERSLFVHRILTRGAEVWTISLSLILLIAETVFSLLRRLLTYSSAIVSRDIDT